MQEKDLKGKEQEVQTQAEKDYEMLHEMQDDINKLEAIPVEDRTEEQKSTLSQLYYYFGRLLGQMKYEGQMPEKPVTTPAQYGMYLAKKYYGHGGHRKKGKRK